jgi:two-component sensor histidine kinase
MPKHISAQVCRKPILRVELRHKGEEYVLTVSDNGRGLPAASDPANAPSLGLHLVRMWAEHQMGGRLEVNSTDGTCYQITFKTSGEAS